MRSKYHPDFKFPSRLYSPAVTNNLLRVLWVILICWGELGVYFWSLSACRWPVHKHASEEALHALVITDTQISVPSLASNSTSLFPQPRRFLANKFLKKSWRVTNWLDPHVVFFLGDMLGSGKLVKNEAQYAELVQKFKSTFPLNTSMPVYHLPGNNDVGMGSASASTRDIRAYYQKHFSPLNGVINIKNHTFFALDAPGLVDEDYQRNAHGASFDHWEPIPGGAVEAVRNVAAQNYHPLILLSHIPLYRPDSASCGPLRESGTIDRGVGRGYQNTLGKQTTGFLMKTLDPSAVFSGDNRDYCEYLHKGTSFGVDGSIPEITVKSFAPTPNIRRPGFQLLSVVDPTKLASSGKQQSLLHRPCLLPNSTIILAGYIWWSFATLCILLVVNVQRIRHFRLTKAPFTPSPIHSHDTTPFLQDTSDTLSLVWSPHTPVPPMPPKSPRSQMPPTFRTPIAPATSTFRASSRPMTPQGFSQSPMLSPQLIPSIHDDEDSMFSDQYTIHRNVRHANDEEWTPRGEGYFDTGPQSESGSPAGVMNIVHSPPPSQFISAPGGLPKHHRKQSSAWNLLSSKTFMLGGRRRAFKFRVPRLSAWWSGLAEMLEVLRDADRRNLLRRRRGIVASTLIESVSVFWPPSIVWLIINYWMF